MSSSVQYINDPGQPHRKLTDALFATAEQLGKLFETRFAMLQAEMKEKIAAYKASAPMIVIGATVAATSFFVLRGGAASETGACAAGSGAVAAAFCSASSFRNLRGGAASGAEAGLAWSDAGAIGSLSSFCGVGT